MKNKKFKNLAFIAITFIMVLSISGCRVNFNVEPALVNTQNIDIDGIEKITIDYNDDDITFYKSDTNELIVKEYMSQGEKKYYAKIETSENEITIESGKRPWFGESYIEVYLPIAYNNDLEVNLDNGDLKINDEFVLDNVNLNSDNGDKEVKNITANIIEIESDNGDLDLNNVVGKYNISSDNGDINIDNAIGYGDFKSNNGGMDIIFEEVTGNIKAESDNGEISLTLPKALAFNYSATTDNGEITTNFNGSLTKSDESQTGIVGENPVVKIEVDTSNGEIDINN